MLWNVIQAEDDGVPSEWPPLVPANTTEPGSTLKRKTQSIAYHFVREGVANDECRTSNVNTHEMRPIC
jgi:hypothetical protein